MGKIATGAECATIGGQGTSSGRLVTKTRLEDYGCELKPSPSHSYGDCQCVQLSDIQAAADPRAVVYLPVTARITSVTGTSDPSPNQVTMELTINAPYADYGNLSTTTYRDRFDLPLRNGSGATIIFFVPGGSQYDNRPYFTIPSGTSFNNTSGTSVTCTMYDDIYNDGDAHFMDHSMSDTVTLSMTFDLTVKVTSSTIYKI